MCGGLLDLFVRTDCVCCARLVPTPPSKAFGHHLCADCLRELSRPWQRWFPPMQVVDVYAAGAYGGPRRSVVISAKDRLRGAAIRMMGRMFYGQILALGTGGVLVDPRVGMVLMVPAPVRRASEKDRGGDVVTKAAREAQALHRARHGSGIEVCRLASLADGARDSVGLGRAQRASNVAGSLELDMHGVRRARGLIDGAQGEVSVVIVDDVCTTGATTSQLALALAAVGIQVDAVLVIAGA